MTIRTRLLLALIPLIIMMLWALSGISFHDSQQTILRQIDRQTSGLVESHARDLNAFFESARPVAEGLAVAVGGMEPLRGEAIDPIIRETLARNPSVFGATAALIPEATPLGRFAPYICRDGSGFRTTSLADPGYDYPKWDWYTRPLREGRGGWSEPYEDVGGGNVLMTTYSALILRDGKPAGIATVDISLEKLVGRVRDMGGEHSGYAFLVSGAGRLIAQPGKGILSRETIRDLAGASPDPGLGRLAGMIRNPRPDRVEMVDPFNGKLSWVTVTGLPSTGWTLVVSRPRDEILRPLSRLKYRVAVLSAGVAGFIGVLIVLVSSSVTAPLRRLAVQARRYAEGHLAERLGVAKGPLEIRELAHGFNRMGEALQAQMENAQTATAQKERCRQELLIAAEIQQGILPKSFRPFPEYADRFDLFGLAWPAREVGGDFFDFFPLPGNRLALVVADVSGKGAASLYFVAMTRLLVREIAERNYQPAEILRRTNHMLCQDNPSSTFVTLLYAEYDLPTGRTRFVSAGHYPPLQVTPAGDVRFLPIRVNLPLGAMPGTHYETAEYALPAGDTLLFFTDGVTRTLDPAGQEFGTARFHEIVGRHGAAGSRPLCEAVRAAAEAFAAGSDQPDDVTLLALRRLAAPEEEGRRSMPLLDRAIRLELPARTDVLEKVVTLTESVARETGFPEADTQRIILALDEVVNNVIMHAYGAGTTETFGLELLPLSDGLRLTVTDYGVPFDFEEKSHRYKGEATIDQPVGGIGLFLARKSLDVFRYEPETFEGNRVVMVKYLPPAKS